MSHLRIAQDAAMDGLKNYLVFEDDAVLSSDFAERLPKVMAEVGEDWDMIYFGGQHLLKKGQPAKVEGMEEVIAPMNLNRTHCFAVNGRFFQNFGRHIMHAPSYIKREKAWHIDHQLGVLHQGAFTGEAPFNGIKIYAVTPWIVGQAAGCSGISFKAFPERWFQVDPKKIKDSR